jgi:hypothetical protein
MKLVTLLLAGALLGVYSNSGSTPRETLVNFIGAERLVVHRINVVGDYAVTYTSGGYNDGGPYRLLLLKHFPFGWQVLDFLDNARCNLTRRSIPRADIAALLRGMPPINNSWGGCDVISNLEDSGPRQDVAAVREAMRAGQAIPTVRVSGQYASAEWYGGGGGLAILGKLNGGWVLLLGGGGAIAVNELVKNFGVPYAIACKIADDFRHQCHGDERAIPSADEQEARILVEQYYNVWSEQAFSAMYALRSLDFREKHPYAAWLPTIAKMNTVDLDSAEVMSPNAVDVQLSSRVEIIGRGYEKTTSRATWHLVREKGILHLDTLNVRSAATTQVTSQPSPTPQAVYIRSTVPIVATPAPTPSPATSPVAFEEAPAAENGDQEQVIKQTIAAVRMMDAKDRLLPVVTKIALMDDFALTQWDWPIGQGEALVEKRNGAWSILYNRTGYITPQGLVSFGVPEPVAQQLLWEKLTPVTYDITARSQGGTVVSIRYRLKQSPRYGEDWAGPIVADGSLKIDSAAHTQSFQLVPALTGQPLTALWLQFITDEDVACGAQPIAFARGFGGHEDVVIRYAIVQKGCYPASVTIDAVTGEVVSRSP